MTKFIALFYTMLAMFLIAVVSYSMQKSEENFSSPKYTIGVVLKAMDSEHWLSVRSGMIEAAQKNNMRLIVITAENETAFIEQNKIISDLLDNDIDALIVSPTNINHTKEFVDNARQKNILVFSIDEEIDGVTYIGSDNYAIGEMATAYLKIAGNKLVCTLSLIDDDFSDVLKNFREKILTAKIHPEILSAFVSELFPEEQNILPSPLQAENFPEWFTRFEKFVNDLRTRHGKDYLHPAIRLALRYIESHYRDEITQSDVAEAVHLNPSYFSTLFKKSFVKGFSDYLTDLRIEHVKEQLVTTTEKIKVISTSEGFTDYQYFCKLFKRLTDLTPSQYHEKFLR